MKINKVNHSYQSYNCADGVANVNIYNGNLLFEYPLCSVGLNSFQINTSLVYNSDYKSTDFNGRIIGMGNGWKLNIEQHLFPYNPSFNLEGFENSDYVYIDSNWNIHRFVKYYPNDDTTYPMHYYDASGTGLRLVISDYSTKQIIDSLNNKYTFDNNGKLISIKSSVNDQINKTIEYDDNKIISIYDSRKEERKIEFIYEEDLLIESKVSTTSISYKLNYENQKLVDVYKCCIENNETFTKKLIMFIYDNNLMQYSISSTDLLGIKYNFLNEQLKTISLGAIHETILTEEIESELYLEEASIENTIYFQNEEGKPNINYLVNNGYKYKGKMYTLPTNNVKEKVTYIYSGKYTDVVYDNDITMRYYFNKEETIISNFELKDELNLFTTFRHKGWKLSNDGNHNFKINNEKSTLIESGNPTYNVSSDKLSEFNKIFDEDLNEDTIKDNKYSEHFKVSFWLNFTRDSGAATVAYPVVELKLDGEEEIRRFKARINLIDENVWQYVVIPINLGGTPKKISSLKIAFFEGEIISTKLVNNVYIEKGSTTDIMLLDDDNIAYKLEVDDEIVFDNNVNTISSEFYFTENDFFETYKNIYFKIDNQFDIVYNNGTKVKRVSSIYLNKDGKNINFKLKNDNTTNYFTKLIDKSSNYIIRAGEYIEYIQWIIYETQVRFHYDYSMDKSYYEFKKSLGAVYENPDYRLSDDKAVVMYSWINQDGTPRAIKDTRKIITECFYDNYGNINSKKTWLENNTEYNIIEEGYTYDENGMNVEYLLYSTYNNQNTEYVYDKNNSLLKKKTYFNSDGQINYSEEYNYDKYNEHIENIIFKNSEDKEITKNHIDYLWNGCIRGLSNIDTIDYSDITEYTTCKEVRSKYLYNYDIYSELKGITINGNKKILLTNNKSDGNETIIQDMYYLDEENNYVVDLSKQIKNTYDKYGRIKEIENKDNTVNFIYEDEIETNSNNSIILSRISKIEDGFSDEERIFEYIDSGDLTSQKEIIDNKYYYKNSSNNKVEYSILDDEEEEVVVYLETPIDGLNNMIKTTNYYLKERGKVYEEPCVEFSYTYDYDACNRFSKKTSNEIVYEKCTSEACAYKDGHPYDYPSTTGYKLIKNIDYYFDSYLPKKIEYTRHYTKLHTYIFTEADDYIPNTYINWTYNLEYDKNNICKITEIDENNNNIERQYTYDDKNQLLKEIVLYKNSSNNTEIEKTVEYLYEYSNKTGLLHKVTKTTTDIINNTIITNIKLIKEINDDLTNEGTYDKLYLLTYDKFGNLISDGNATMTYNSRNQLESYRCTKNVDNIYNFYYNYQGVRYKKKRTINNEISFVNYYLNGSTILGEDWTDENGNVTHRLKYFYDLEGICGIRYNGYNFSLVKDSLGNISRVMYDGNKIGQYNYDAWGNCIDIEEDEYLTTVTDENLKNSLLFVLYNNPFRYKGYYYDVETGYFWLSSRYYSPELGRFIQPADVSSLNPHSINGLNLYAYANNNPIGSANVGMLSGFSAITMLSSYKLPITNSNVGSRNYWDPHIKGKWFDTDVPEFFNFTHDKIEFVNWCFSVYKGSLYFDHNENHSLYIAGGNISAYLGIGAEGAGLDLGANVLEIGYDGRIIDANVEFLTIGLTFMYKDGTFEFGVGAGWFGYSVTIDIDEIIKIIFGG